MVKAHLSERDRGLGGHLCQEGTCSQEHELFLRSLLALDFLIAGKVDHPVGAIPQGSFLLLENIFPKSIALLGLVLVAELCE